MRLYYIRHGFEGSDSYFTHHLTTLASAILQQQKLVQSTPSGSESSPTKNLEMNREDMRNTIILAAKGLHDQGANYYLAINVFNVVQGAMDAEDINVLQRFVHSAALYAKMRTELIISKDMYQRSGHLMLCALQIIHRIRN